MSKGSVLGIDVGGSGIKGAIVDVHTGELLSERYRIDTPNPSKPASVAKAFATVVNHFKWKKAIGVGFPAIIKEGHAMTAANIDKTWIGTNAKRIFSEATNCPVAICNDADVAGLAEMTFGAGKGYNGTLLMITIGSGLGSALFCNGRILPNSELGHLYLKGHSSIVEKFAADSARKREGLDWQEWCLRFNQFIDHIELIFSPDLIVLGGGASKKFSKYSEYLVSQAPVLPAKLLNNAGIIGGALYAHQKMGTKVKVKI